MFISNVLLARMLIGYTSFKEIEMYSYAMNHAESSSIFTWQNRQKRRETKRRAKINLEGAAFCYETVAAANS